MYSDKQFEAKEKVIELIKQSWTWELLTKEERNTFLEYNACESYYAQGTPKQVEKTIMNYYQFFLFGIGLNDKNRFKI